MHEQAIARQVLKGYQVNIRPRGINAENPNAKDGGPVLVYTTIILKTLTNINDANMEFTVQFLFKQEWYDTRLRFEHLDKSNQLDFITLASDQHVWIPDTFFQNEKTGKYHNVDKANMYIKVRYDGRVIYSRRLSMTFACVMHLGRYPHDTQACEMAFATYAYTTVDIEYIWSKEAIVDDMSSRMRPKFFIESLNNGTCTSKTNTGEYSCLQVELQLRRVFSYFLLQLYIPSCMLVAVSCVSYWIDWRSSPARVSLSIVSLLTMITQSHCACILFIFSSLIEYAFVNYTGVLENRRKAALKEKGQKKLANQVQTAEAARPIAAKLSRSQRKALTNSRAQSQRNIFAFILELFRPHERRLEFENLPLQDIQSQANQQPSVIDASSPCFSDDFNTPGENRRKRQALRNLVNLFKQMGTAERIDLMSRILFPAMFACFNIAYWTAYW